ncbi:DUF2972 domain-containing protein, partial [Campylobacter molothri]|nr:DUF2972 domain-containing protein [Campylobacter sp. RM9754]
HNPNSAVERIKNHLAYKLGQAMIEYNKNGGGYLTLFKKLYNIKKQHKKEKQIYQETIKVFPTLKYPELKQCPDYNEALKCYFHLSYMLGEALIKSYQSWYRGGGFKLYSYIKKVNKEFKLFQDIFKEFDQINSNAIEGIANNKQLFLKEFPKIKNLLNIHKDYQPIIENIFHNFDYVTKNFNLIEEWLLSNDFNEKYKKENHPYPSLLDPKKLNDEKEEINYKSIPAELAWEMNLPLPDNYKFVFLLIHGAGTSAMTYYLKLCNINMNRHYGDPIYQYIDSYKILLSDSYNIIILAGRDYGMKKEIFKFYSLLQKEVPAICVVRDPISTLKPIINHFGIFDPKQIKNDIKIFENFDELFNVKVSYWHVDQKGNIDLERCLKDFSQEYDNYNILNDRIQIKNLTNIFYISMDDIKTENAFFTLKKMSKIFNFQEPQDLYAILNFTNSGNDYSDYYFFPKKFYLTKDQNRIFFYLEKENDKNDDFVNCIKYFTDIKMFYDKKISVYLKNTDFLKLKDNLIEWDKICQYFKFFFIKLEDFYINERKKLKTERDILSFMKQNRDIAFAFKNKFDKDYVHIKQHRPDIVASWKYYQEFEKMCEELD